MFNEMNFPNRKPARKCRDGNPPKPEPIPVKVDSPTIRGEGLLKKRIQGQCILEMPGRVFAAVEEKHVSIIPNKTVQKPQYITNNDGNYSIDEWAGAA